MTLRCGDICVIVASGPSAKDAPLELARGAFVIVVNSSWRIAPWADALFAGDPDWWIENNGCPEFAGRKFTSADNVTFEGVKRVDIALRRASSGHQALALAIAWGFTRILLVGFDMRLDEGTHWHEPHAGSNPTAEHIKRWRLDLEGAAIPDGVEIINCSMRSALERFPKMRLEDALA